MGSVGITISRQLPGGAASCRGRPRLPIGRHAFSP